jgi:hypothetical protein
MTDRHKQIAARIEAAILACPEPWQRTAIVQAIHQAIAEMTAEGLVVPWKVEPLKGLAGQARRAGE